MRMRILSTEHLDIILYSFKPHILHIHKIYYYLIRKNCNITAPKIIFLCLYYLFSKR